MPLSDYFDTKSNIEKKGLSERYKSCVYADLKERLCGDSKPIGARLSDQWRRHGVVDRHQRDELDAVELSDLRLRRPAILREDQLLRMRSDRLYLQMQNELFRSFRFVAPNGMNSSP